MRKLIRTAGVAAALVSSVWLAAPAPPDGRRAPGRGSLDTTLTVLDKRCTGCHNAQLASGGLNLQALAKSGIAADRDRWERVLERVQTRQMPPKGTPPLPDAEREQVTAFLETELDRIERASPAAGRVTIRRLNRTEYNNTVRDLLGVDFQPADDFPPDDTGYGFDNIGEVLSMSPALMEKYVVAAEKVARAAVFGAPVLKPVMVSHQPWFVDFATSREARKDYDETGMSLPSALHVMHRFPVEGEYEIAGLLRGTRPDGSEDIPVAFWIDGKQVKILDYPVPPGGEVSGQRRQFRIRVPAGEHWLAASVLRIYEGLPAAYGGPNPSKKPPPAPRRFGGIAPSNNDEAPNAEVPAPRGERKQGQKKGLSGRSPIIGGLPRQATTAYFVSNLDITGPFDQTTGPSAASLQKVFACGHRSGSHQVGCERKILGTLARRAYRRPATQQDLEVLLRFAAMAQQQGDSFEEGIAIAIQKMLISPAFLFRVEREPESVRAGASYRILDYELASRLSYFLWSSPPDEELLELAGRRRLGDAKVLESQVRRMLLDPKSRALVENAGAQWLQFRALESHAPDRKRFQEYTDYTRLSMQKETELFLENLIREDRSILDLIDGRYTFLNERLAAFYGIPGVRGHEFRKVDLTGTPRAGIVTHASVLTVSSYANRTSPVLRGKWILENLFNAAPPPAPPDVPNLDEGAVGTTGSLRQQMEKHRENSACASCHSRMDQLGFGLENFDAIGQWRTMDGKFTIDASGLLPDGRKFRGPEELAAILKADAPLFAEAMTSRLLTYALGRAPARADRAVVKEIARRLSLNGYKFSTLILEIVNSRPFRMQTARKPDAPTRAKL